MLNPCTIMELPLNHLWVRHDVLPDHSACVYYNKCMLMIVWVIGLITEYTC